MRTVTGLDTPYGIAFNDREEMIVSERFCNKLLVFDRSRRNNRTIIDGDSSHQMINPAGIAIDDSDNIFVTSQHKLQKFTSTGELINYSKEGEFDDPRGSETIWCI